MTVTLHHGNCLEVIPTLPDCSVDSIVTDPPYELGFMGKKWDASGIAYNITLWQECLRVLKPGGHLLAFGGTRTYHRMACAIEDAGFEIRDSIHWLYGSGFPKSLDVSKAIDKVNGEPDRLLKFTAWMRTTGLTARQLDQLTDSNMGGHYLTSKSQPAIPTAAMWEVIRPHVGEIPEWVDELVARIEAEREVIGPTVPGAQQESTGKYGAWGEGITPTAPATEQAKQWAGWGTALKPAHEPVVVARKPLVGTVASNVLEWGTGAINIDASRIGYQDGEYDPTKIQRQQHSSGAIEGAFGASALIGKEIQTYKEGGRWPANVILSHHEDCDDRCVAGCAVAELDRQSGVSKSQSGTFTITKSAGTWDRKDKGMFDAGRSSTFEGYGDTGGASRFFYCAKPSRRERNTGLDHLEKKQGGSMTGAEYMPDKPTNHPVRQNHHPTVKPLALMRYLIRLVTPPNGTVLEPFAGSGTTLMAATLENFHAIGIEMTDEYLPIIEGRVAWAEQEANKQQEELDL